MCVASTGSEWNPILLWEALPAWPNASTLGYLSVKQTLTGKFSCFSKTGSIHVQGPPLPEHRSMTWCVLAFSRALRRRGAMGAYKVSSPRMHSSVSVTASRHELGNQD